MLQQSLSVPEWAHHWSVCRDYLELVQVPARLHQQTLDCLENWREFSQSASLACLDRCLGDLGQLVPHWDHWWWVAQRSGQPWPRPSASRECLAVTRQGSRSRVSWTCPGCGWQLSWDVQVAVWESLVWPGPVTCPLCPEASSDGPHPAESPPIGSAR